MVWSYMWEIWNRFGYWKKLVRIFSRNSDIVFCYVYFYKKILILLYHWGSPVNLMAIYHLLLVYKLLKNPNFLKKLILFKAKSFFCSQRKFDVELWIKFLSESTSFTFNQIENFFSIAATLVLRWTSAYLSLGAW